MKLTFPHLGNMYIPVKTFLDEINAEYVIPPFNNKQALEIGTRYAPELACLPLKINIGNFIQAHRKGADTIIMAGGCGPCRLGYYSEIEQGILRDIGVDMEVIALEKPEDGFYKLFSRLKRIIGTSGISNAMIAAEKAAYIAILVDRVEKLTYKTRPREKIKGTTDKIYNAFKVKALKVQGYKAMKSLIDATLNKLKVVELDNCYSPPRLAIVGEIYTTIDSHTSFNIDAHLGNMGIEIDRTVTISEWITDHILKNAFHIPFDKDFKEAASPYLGAKIGGHALETIGHTVLYANKGYDGVIQIYPLGCMPEIVAQSILPTVEKAYNIPVLSLIIDEMTGEAGYMTRVEAFLDVLKKRREIVAIG